MSKRAPAGASSAAGRERPSARPAMYSSGGSLTVTDGSSIVGSSAGDLGGLLYTQGGTATFRNTTILDSTAANFAADGTISFQDAIELIRVSSPSLSSPTRWKRKSFVTAGKTWPVIGSVFICHIRNEK